MKYEEYQNSIMELIKDPDTALTKVDGVLEALKADISTKESFEAKIAEQDSRIRTLQDTNMQLFLRASGEVPKEEPEIKEKTIDEKFDDLVKESGNE